jgi:hypothetical protein
MLFAERIVVRARGREWRRSGRLTASNGVEMNAVRSRRDMRRSNVDVHHTIIALPELRGTDAVPAAVGERSSRGGNMVATKESRRTSGNRCNCYHHANRLECSHFALR